MVSSIVIDQYFCPKCHLCHFFAWFGQNFISDFSYFLIAISVFLLFSICVISPFFGAYFYPVPFVQAVSFTETFPCIPDETFLMKHSCLKQIHGIKVKLNAHIFKSCIDLYILFQLIFGLYQHIIFIAF